MNYHAILTEEDYTFFSRLMKPTSDDIEYEFSTFIETPFWVEVQEGLDHYILQRELLSNLGLQFNEKSFTLKFLVLIVIYFTIIAFVSLHIMAF